MKPAARVTDLHTCPMVTGVVPHVGGPILPPGHPMTLIAGLPAARLGDMAVCVGPPDVIVSGSAGCLIGGMPAARMGDQTAHGGIITLGCLTVLIGDSGSGGGGGGGSATASGVSASYTPPKATMQALVMKEAKASAKPFCEQCAAAVPPVARSGGAQADALRAARQDGIPFCEDCAAGGATA